MDQTTLLNDLEKEKVVLRSLQGTWAQFKVFPDTSAQEMKVTFLPGGYITVHVGFTLPDGNLGEYKYSGTWEFMNQCIFFTVNASTAPERIPVGFNSVDRILRLTQKELVLVDGISNTSEVFEREK